jgi:chemotaxis protein MotB
MKLAELSNQQDEGDSNPFYISLSDLMTLLCVLFIMLISISKIDIGSFEQVRTGFTGSSKGTLVELARELKEVVDGDPGIPGVTVRLAKDGVRLDLDTAALFDTGSAAIKKGSLEPLAPILLMLEKTKYTIDVEGHTDDVPLYRKEKQKEEIETNWSLSGRRASSVVHHLLSVGFASDRVRIVGYADTHPISDPAGKEGEELEQARAENRRVSLLVR